MNEEYIQAIQKAQSELEVIENRRNTLIKAIEHLRSLCDEEFPELTPPPGYVPEGLTPEIRKILTAAAAHMTPVQIREALIARNFPNSSSKNLLINVHTALGRIKEELDVIERDGKPAYKINSMLGVFQMGEFMAKELAMSNLMSESLAAAARMAAEATQPTMTDTMKKIAEGFSKPTLAQKIEAQKGRRGGLALPPKPPSLAEKIREAEENKK